MLLDDFNASLSPLTGVAVHGALMETNVSQVVQLCQPSFKWFALLLLFEDRVRGAGARRQSAPFIKLR